MFRSRRFALTALVLANVAAACIGVTAALAGGALSPGKVGASNHCTHYTPVVHGDTASWCSEVYNISPNFYATAGQTLRDSDLADANSAQLVCTSYDPSSYWSCNNVSSSENFESSSGGLAYANCILGDGGYSLCKTNWHK